MVAVSMVWRWLLNGDYGIINYFLHSMGLETINFLGDEKYAMISVVLIGIWKSLGFNMVILISAFKEVPVSLYEAAEIDGANYLQKVRAITIPLLRNILQLSLIMTSVGGLYTFPQVYIMTKGGPGNSTETIMMYMYKQVFSNQRFGLGSSIAVVAILETCIVLVIIMMLTKQKKMRLILLN